MPLLYQPHIFKPHPAVRAGVTLRSVSGSDPFGNNMSLTVGDDEPRVWRNRERAAAALGFAQMATQRQVYGSNCRIGAEGYAPAESDALMTDQPGWLLAVSIADCIPVLLFARQRKVVAAIHSGWRGSQQNIAGTAVAQMMQRYGVAPVQRLQLAPEVGSHFVKAAWHKRGLVAWVERPGLIAVGNEVEVIPP